MLKFDITKRKTGKIIRVTNKLNVSQESQADKLQILLNQSIKERNDLRLIQNSMQDGLIVFDTKGTVLSCNDSIKKMLGIKDCFIGAKRDIKNMGQFFDKKIIFEKDAPLSFDEIVNLSKKEIDYNIRAIDNKGGEVVLHVLISPIVDNNEVVGVLACYRDITELENEKRKAETERRKWEAVFDHTADGVAVISNNNHLVLGVNAALERIIGFKEAEVIGKDIHKFMGTHESDKKSDCLITKSLERKGDESEGLLRRSNGEHFWAALTASAVTDPNIPHKGLIIITVRDITKEKELEQIKNEFISIVSHELRTPLTAANGYLSMMIKGDAGPLEPKQLHFLNRIYLSTERMVNLAEDLLVINRLETHRLVLNIVSLDLPKILIEVIDELTLKGLSRQICISQIIPKNIPKVLADSDRLRQILFNLIDNAIKYSHNGSNVDVIVSAENDFVKIQIKDSGVGISDFDRGKLFKKFVRIQNELSVKAGGSGLGLYITSIKILAQGGKISVESEIGKGTTFIFTLLKSK